jgi:hypothetical protein
MGRLRQAQQERRVIAPLLGWFIGSYIGRKVGVARGERAADALAWQLATTLAGAPQAPPRPHQFVGHPDGSVSEEGVTR